MRSRISLLLSALAVTFGLVSPVIPAAQASTISLSAPKASAMVMLTNKARSRHHLAALRTNAELAKVARAHSLRMAREAKLYHNPRLRYQVTSFRYLGENVGYSPDVYTVQRAFMNSPSHRANILNRSYTQVGIGVAVSGDRIWVTEVFRKP